MNIALFKILLIILGMVGLGLCITKIYRIQKEVRVKTNPISISLIAMGLWVGIFAVVLGLMI